MEVIVGRLGYEENEAGERKKLGKRYDEYGRIAQCPYKREEEERGWVILVRF